MFNPSALTVFHPKLTAVNHRIYKPKYAEEGTHGNDCSEGIPAKQTTPEKPQRDKSRTRTLFGRKKSIGTKVP